MEYRAYMRDNSNFLILFSGTKTGLELTYCLSTASEIEYIAKCRLYMDLEEGP